MSIDRRNALVVIAGLSFRLRQHLEKMRADPFAIDYNHWPAEVENWISQIEKLTRHIGRRTALEVLTHVEEWKKEILE